VIGRLNPHLGWKWRDADGKMRSYLITRLSRNAGMLSGIVLHSGVVATRPIQDYDRISLDGFTWFPVQEVLALIPLETQYELPREVVPVPLNYRVDDQEIL